MLDVCLLGTSGMMPLPGRFLASCIIKSEGVGILIDCGEGTQIPMQSIGWGFRDINTILFTHYHADHIYGIIGILYQMNNVQRTETLNIMGPRGIDKIKNIIGDLTTRLSFDIIFQEIEDNYKFNIGKIEIKNIFLKHTMPCYGYSFTIKRLPEFCVEKAIALKIPLQYWKLLQHGDNIQYNGNVYTPDMVLGRNRKGIKVVYATDYIAGNNLIDFAKDSDLFIGEGMYWDKNEIEAYDKMHSSIKTTMDIAKRANVSNLWLTHYSPRLRNPENYINAINSFFPRTQLGVDLMHTTLKFED